MGKLRACSAQQYFNIVATFTTKNINVGTSVEGYIPWPYTGIMASLSGVQTQASGRYNVVAENVEYSSELHTRHVPCSILVYGSSRAKKQTPAML